MEATGPGHHEGDRRPIAPNNHHGESSQGQHDRTVSPYLTTREAATYLRYRGASAVRNLVAAGKLKAAGDVGGHGSFE